MTKELLKLMAVASLAIASTASVVHADPSPVCKAVDLRNERVAPVRSQMYVDELGVLTESGLCHAFAAANLAGQAIGASVSPVTLALHAASADEHEEGFGSDPVLVTGFDVPGGTEDDLRLAMRSGLCTQTRLDSVLGHDGGGASTLQDVYDFVRDHGAALTVDQATVWLDQQCGPLTPLAGFEVVHAKARDANEQLDPARIRDMVATIDRVLDQGRFVAMTDGGHAVTVVGRTADCSLLIQDSIPKSWWDVNKGRELQLSQLASTGDSITYLTDYVQAWSRGAVLQEIRELTYLEPRSVAKASCQRAR